MSGMIWPAKIFMVVWAIVFFGILAIFITMLVKGIKREADNKKQPVETADVRVITKRILVTGEHSHTTYFVTFENASSARQEFQVDGELYGLLVEGDNGKLTYQGYKVMDFNRY
jgi:hypothetical protein